MKRESKESLKERQRERVREREREREGAREKREGSGQEEKEKEGEGKREREGERGSTREEERDGGRTEMSEKVAFAFFFVHQTGVVCVVVSQHTLTDNIWYCRILHLFFILDIFFSRIFLTIILCDDLVSKFGSAEEPVPPSIGVGSLVSNPVLENSKHFADCTASQRFWAQSLNPMSRILNV